MPGTFLVFVLGDRAVRTPHDFSTVLDAHVSAQNVLAILLAVSTLVALLPIIAGEVFAWRSSTAG